MIHIDGKSGKVHKDFNRFLRKTMINKPSDKPSINLVEKPFSQPEYQAFYREIELKQKNNQDDIGIKIDT